jgi:hypothetical protein
MSFGLDPELRRVQVTVRELSADFATRAARHNHPLRLVLGRDTAAGAAESFRSGTQ